MLKLNAYWNCKNFVGWNLALNISVEQNSVLIDCLKLENFKILSEWNSKGSILDWIIPSLLQIIY